MPLSLIIFDCDGVLLESVDAKTQAFRQVAEQFGPEARDRLVLFHTLHGGVSRYEKFRWLYREVLGREITQQEMNTLAAQFVQCAFNNVINAPFVPGALDVLKTWKGRIPMYVCSGTPQSELVSIFRKRGLEDYFEGIRGAPPAKAVMLGEILHKTGVDPAKAVMVGDATTDREAAEINGTMFYGRGRNFAGSPYAWGEDLTRLNAWLMHQSGLNPI